MIMLIKLFISYTSNIYKSETVNKYDNPFERFKSSYRFYDTLEVTLNDSAFIDESLKYKIET